jgi:hypothetical protein
MYETWKLFWLLSLLMSPPPGMFARLHCLHWAHLRSSFLCILTNFAFCITWVCNLVSCIEGRNMGWEFSKAGCWGKYLGFIGRRKICPHATLATTNLTWTVLGLNVCGIWGGQNCNATGVSPSTWVLPCDYHSASAPFSYLIHVPFDAL